MIKFNNSDFYSDGNQYDKLVYFMHKGKKNIVTVQNKRNLVFYAFSKFNKFIKVIPMPYEADIVEI
jgi:hypothetical protein